MPVLVTQVSFQVFTESFSLYSKTAGNLYCLQSCIWGPHERIYTWSLWSSCQWHLKLLFKTEFKESSFTFTKMGFWGEDILFEVITSVCQFQADKRSMDPIFEYVTIEYHTTYVLHSSGISRKSAALIVRYSQKKNFISVANIVLRIFQQL